MHKSKKATNGYCLLSQTTIRQKKIKINNDGTLESEVHNQSLLKTIFLKPPIKSYKTRKSLASKTHLWEQNIIWRPYCDVTTKATSRESVSVCFTFIFRLVACLKNGPVGQLLRINRWFYQELPWAYLISRRNCHHWKLIMKLFMIRDTFWGTSSSRKFLTGIKFRQVKKLSTDKLIFYRHNKLSTDVKKSLKNNINSRRVNLHLAWWNDI